MLLQSCEERNSPRNMQCGSAAVALITQAIQPLLLAAPTRHTTSRTCVGGGQDECTHLHNLISSIRPPPPLVSPKTPSWTGLPGKGQVLSAVCCWGWGARTKGAFIAVGSGCLRTDNGLILLILRQIAVCSLPFQGEERAVGAGD